MIDYKNSAKLNNCDVRELKKRFERFPHSQKKIVAICESCKCKRILTFSDYGDLCQSCATIKSHIDHPNMGIKSSKHMKDNNPMKDIKVAKKMGRSLKRYHQDNPEVGKKRGTMLKNSTKHKESIKKFYGGYDIVNHHIAYDFNHPEALTVKVTRSFHGRIHSPPGMNSRERRYSLID